MVLLTIKPYIRFGWDKCRSSEYVLLVFFGVAREREREREVQTGRYILGLEADLRSTGVKVCPGSDEFSEVVGAEDRGVPRQIVKVVHDDGHEQVEHDEAAEEDEGDEVDV